MSKRNRIIGRIGKELGGSEIGEESRIVIHGFKSEYINY